MTSRKLWIGLFLIFVVSFFILVSVPMDDSDFFWHLSTGRWIYEHGRLPHQDPFCVTTPPGAYTSLTRTEFILQQFWLAQLILYVVYLAGGIFGVVLFVSLLFSLILLFLFRWLLKEGVGPSSALFLLLPPAFLLGEFVGARPNQMTFAMALLTLYLSEETRKQSKIRILLPLCMLVWANLHGGYIIGDAIILIYMAGETSRLIYRKHCGSAYPGYRSVMLVYGAALAAGFLNPQGYNAFIITWQMEGSLLYRTITENQSPVVMMASTGMRVFLYSVILYALMSAFHIAESLRKKRLDLAHVMLLVFLISISLKSIRFIPIMGLLATPVLAGSFAPPLEKALSKTGRFGIPQSLFLFLLIALSVTQFRYTIFRRPVISEHFPVAAVEFLKREKPTGNIFSFIDYGGYVEWELYPQKRNFIDGRNLVLSVYNAQAAILAGAAGWEGELDRYGVKNIILPPVMRTGEWIQLIYEIYRDKDWKLVYEDGRTFVFSKDERIPELPKLLVFPDVFAAADRMAVGSNPLPYVSAARALEMMGRDRDAATYLEEALREKPYLRETAVGTELRRLGGE